MDAIGQANKTFDEDTRAKLSRVLKTDPLRKSWRAAAKATGKAPGNPTGMVPPDDSGIPIAAAKRSSKKKSLLSKINPQQDADEEERSSTYSTSTTNKEPINYSHLLQTEGNDSDDNKNLCALTIASLEALHCLHFLREVHTDLVSLSDDNFKKKDKLKKQGKQKVAVDEERGDTAVGTPFLALAKSIVQLTRDFFVLVYKLNETALGFHVVEDFLRDANNVATLDFSSTGRIRLPRPESTDITVTQIFFLTADAAAQSDAFIDQYPEEKAMHSLFQTLVRSLQHLKSAAGFSKDVFESVLYGTRNHVKKFQEFTQELNSIQRSDIIMEMQNLRRRIDEIAIFLEKLSWKSYLLLGRAKDFSLKKGKGTTIGEDGQQNQLMKKKSKVSANDKKLSAPDLIKGKSVSTINKSKKVKRKTKKSVAEQIMDNLVPQQYDGVLDDGQTDVETFNKKAHSDNSKVKKIKPQRKKTKK